MQRAFTLARGIRPQSTTLPRRISVLPLSARSIAPLVHHYATDATPEDSEPIASSSTSSSPAPVPPTREQLLELFKRAEGSIDLDELMASLNDAPEDGSEQPGAIHDMFPLDSTIEEFKGDDSTSLGHRMLAEQRIVLDYFRKIELEMPSLKSYKKPFRPVPSSTTPVIARTISFGGQKDIPSSQKAALVVPVAHLPLSGHPGALHKFKLLAGVRWSLDPPKDAGLAKSEIEELKVAEGKEGHGYFKISHEAFPELAMNLKWCSDTLDRLVIEANDGKDAFADIPLDTRHLDSQVQKRGTQRPTIADFPQEWLSSPKQVERLRKHLLEPKRRKTRRSANPEEIISAVAAEVPPTPL